MPLAAGAAAHGAPVERTAAAGAAAGTRAAAIWALEMLDNSTSARVGDRGGRGDDEREQREPLLHVDVRDELERECVPGAERSRLQVSLQFDPRDRPRFGDDLADAAAVDAVLGGEHGVSHGGGASHNLRAIGRRELPSH